MRCDIQKINSPELVENTGMLILSFLFVGEEVGGGDLLKG